MAPASSFGDGGSGLGQAQATGVASASGTTTHAPYITTQAVAGTTLASPAINGDTDGDYDFDAEITLAAASTSIEFKVNGVSGSFSLGCNTTNGPNERADWKISTAAANPLAFALGDKVYIAGFIISRTGRPRQMHAHIYKQPVTGHTSDNLIDMHGIWTDTATLLTGFSLVGDAGAIAIGSYLRLCPRGRTL